MNKNITRTEIIKRQIAEEKSEIHFIDSGFFLRRYLIENEKRLFNSDERKLIHQGLKNKPSASFDVDWDTELYIRNAAEALRNRDNNRYRFRHMIYDLENWIIGSQPLPTGRQGLLKIACMLKMNETDTNKLLLLCGKNPLNRRNAMEFAYMYYVSNDIDFTWEDIQIQSSARKESRLKAPEVEQSEELRKRQKNAFSVKNDLQKYVDEHSDYFCGESIRSIYAFRKLVYLLSSEMSHTLNPKNKEFSRFFKSYDMDRDDFLEKLNMSDLVKRTYELLMDAFNRSRQNSPSLVSSIRNTMLDIELSGLKKTGADEFVDRGTSLVRKKAVGSLYTKINNIKETLSAMVNQTGAVDWQATTNNRGHKAPEYVDRKHVLFLLCGYLLLVLEENDSSRLYVEDNVDYSKVDANGSVARLCDQLTDMLDPETIRYNIREMEEEDIPTYIDQFMSDVLTLFEFPGLYGDEADGLFLQLGIQAAREYRDSKC